MKESEHDRRRRRELRRMRGIATGLLAAMAAVYVATRWAEGRYALAWLGYAQSFAEAAMVGAIADWFAVTALFRHPFGLPIPHTAIIPRNKDRLGESLGRFVASEFLTAEAIGDKLRSIDIAGHVAAWLAVPDNARLVAGRLAGGVPPVLDALGDEHVKAFARDGVVQALRSVDFAPVMGRVLAVLVANRRHQMLFDRLIELAGDFLYANHDTIRHKIADRSKWWMPKFVDEKLFRKIVDGIEDTLFELRDPNHSWREQFNAAVEDYVWRLSAGQVHRERGEAIKREVLSNPVVLQYFDSVWGDVKQRLRDDAADPDGSVRQAIERVLVALGHQLGGDAAMRAIVNDWIERVAVTELVPHRDKIGGFFSGVVQRWETATVVEKMELLVGKDLQYVRINGTLVGGTVGLLIHALGTAVG